MSVKTLVASNEGTVCNARWQWALKRVRNSDFINEVSYNYFNSDIINGIAANQERAPVMLETVKKAAGFEKEWHVFALNAGSSRATGFTSPHWFLKAVLRRGAEEHNTMRGIFLKREVSTEMWTLLKFKKNQPVTSEGL